MISVTGYLTPCNKSIIHLCDTIDDLVNFAVYVLYNLISGTK